VHAWCKAFRLAKDAVSGALIAAGRGDVSKIRRFWRHANCRSRMIGFVVAGARLSG
jgi:hypothetical protein